MTVVYEQIEAMPIQCAKHGGAGVAHKISRKMIARDARDILSAEH